MTLSQTERVFPWSAYLQVRGRFPDCLCCFQCLEVELWVPELSKLMRILNVESGLDLELTCCRNGGFLRIRNLLIPLDFYFLVFIWIQFLWFMFCKRVNLRIRILGWFWCWLLVLFLVLDAPPVQTAGRGRAHLRRGAHSTCKLILEMCVGFLISKFLNPHMFYIYDYHYDHWIMRFYMHASISVGDIW